MSEENIKSEGVEMPETDKGEGKAVKFSGGSFIGIVTFFAGLVLAAIASLWLLSGREELIASRPELEKIWVVSRVEGEDVASNKSKTVKDGRGVMLYLIAYGYDKTEKANFYYMDPPNGVFVDVEIDGKLIPKEKITQYDFIGTNSLVYWQKVELNDAKLRSKRIPVQEKISWTKSRKHEMGSKWWAVADVRSDIKKYHYDYVGTMYFVAELETFSSSDSSEIFSDVDSYTETKDSFGKIPSEAHRVTMLPGYRVGLDRAYRAFFNLFVFQEQKEETDVPSVTEEFRGGDSRSVMIGALKLMGYDIDYNDKDFLGKIAEKKYDNVLIDDFHFLRPNETDTIPVGKDGIENGDIIVAGERYMVFVRNDPSPIDATKYGALNEDDFVLDAWNDVVRQRRISGILEEWDKENIEIWRLKQK